MTTKTATKPFRLEMNNSGAWKIITRFDGADEARTDALMNAAAKLAKAVNDGLPKPVLTLRIVTDEPHPLVLMYQKGVEWWPNARSGGGA